MSSRYFMILKLFINEILVNRAANSLITFTQNSGPIFLRLTALSMQKYKHVFPFVKRSKMRSDEDLLIYCLLTDLEFVFLLVL